MTVKELLLTKRENMDIVFNIKAMCFSTLHYTDTYLLEKWKELGIENSKVDSIEITDLYTLEVYSFK